VNVTVGGDPFGPPEVVSLPESLAPAIQRAQEAGARAVSSDPHLAAVYKETLGLLRGVLAPVQRDFAADAPAHYKREAEAQLRAGVAKVYEAAGEKLNAAERRFQSLMEDPPSRRPTSADLDTTRTLVETLR